MAKLSLKTIDVVGEDVLDQLIQWMNDVEDYRRLVRQEWLEHLTGAIEPRMDVDM